MRGSMKRRTPFGFYLAGVCAAGFGAVAPQCRSDARGTQALSIVREKGYPRPWNPKGGIVARAGQVDPSIPRY